ncbi:motile sperm domain-containing protein 2-like protein [Leptotrombidium deliense]|uniref:Motile sperm domain-containing protein 2-like protein n=1 Tax=Leptotrombidium deliense TaxID=299467 RepID=A0A443S4F1_9ACAR|nr:motile sperm domain-containing protein 2-like protein [Leptotrombidium deliense]
MSSASEANCNSSEHCLDKCNENTKVAEIQRILIEKYRKNETLFDEFDVNKIVKDEKYVNSYLMRQKCNLNDTVSMIENALIWRKEHCLSKLCETSFSREFYEIGALFIQGIDIEDNILLFVRAKYSSCDKKCREAFRRTAAYFMFKAHENALYENRNGWTLFMDMSDVRISECDILEFFNILKILVNYIPSGLKRIIIFQMPSFVKIFMKIGTAVLPTDWKQIIAFADSNDITKYIAVDQLPHFITKTGESFVADIPANVKCFDECDCEVIGIKNEDKFAFKSLIAKWKSLQ